MGTFQEERQVPIASPFCKFAHGIESVRRDGDAERDLRPSRRHLSRRRVPDGRRVQLDLPFRPAAGLRQGDEGHPGRHRARGDRPQQGNGGGLGRPTGRV